LLKVFVRSMLKTHGSSQYASVCAAAIECKFCVFSVNKMIGFKFFLKNGQYNTQYT
jgi:hypothetical protein